MRTLSSVQVSSPMDAERAVRHLAEILSRYDAHVWASGADVKVSLELQGESPSQRMAAWRRIVTEELEVVGIEVVRYE